MVIFQFEGGIASESEISEYFDNIDIVKEKKIEFELKNESICLDSAFESKLIENLLLRYIAERIAVVLRNKEEKYIVYEEYNKNSIYQATSPVDHKVFEKIIVHSGFRYKPILLYNDRIVAIIIEPKFKFFSLFSLRDIVDKGEDLSEYNDYYIEKICPIEECDFYLNPYGLCELSYPCSFDKLDEVEINKNEKPSDGFDLIEFYTHEINCPMGTLSKKLSKSNVPPVIFKKFYNNPKPYKYALNVLQFVPKTKDAGSSSKQLIGEIQPKIFQRYQLFKTKFLQDILDISDLEFPIIPDSYS